MSQRKPVKVRKKKRRKFKRKDHLEGLNDPQPYDLKGQLLLAGLTAPKSPGKVIGHGTRQITGGTPMVSL